jgi:hypothetical protein
MFPSSRYVIVRFDEVHLHLELSQYRNILRHTELGMKTGRVEMNAYIHSYIYGNLQKEGLGYSRMRLA